MSWYLGTAADKFDGNTCMRASKQVKVFWLTRAMSKGYALFSLGMHITYIFIIAFIFTLYGPMVLLLLFNSYRPQAPFSLKRPQVKFANIDNNYRCVEKYHQ